MAYWLDEGWHNWPEILRAGTAAAGLYARCGGYVADKKTDGFIPSEIARTYGTAEWIGRLVDVGLWLVEEHGFRDTRYLELNATKAVIEERKAQAAERQRRARASRETHAKVTRDDHVTHKTPSPPPKGGKGAARGALQAVPEWCGRCHGETRRVIDDHNQWVPCPECSPRRTA
jgi:hypothetical protein